MWNIIRRLFSFTTRADVRRKWLAFQRFAPAWLVIAVMTFLWLQTAGGLFGPVAALVVSISIHILAGVFIGLFILGSIPPGVQALIIDPNKNRPKPDPGEPPPKFPPHYEASRAGVFTPLRPGEAKMIETWNGSFIRGAMNYQERRWRGEPDGVPLTPLHQAYWGVGVSGKH